MFTEENIKKLEEFYNTVSVLKTQLTEEYSKALEASKNNTYKITRKEKEVEATGADLWYEVQNLGVNCQAGQFLKTLFPQVFELSEKYDLVVKELNEFSQKELGINPTAITLIDIIKIVKGVVNLKN